MVTLFPERYLTAWVSERIEQSYYAVVNEQSKLEYQMSDLDILESASVKPAFFSDHGVIHVRDVAKQILRVLQIINGVLIPRRTEQHMDAFLYGYGVALAYLHDIGMSVLSQFGRAMHPEFAAQSVFDGSLDDVIYAMWFDNCGNIAWHLSLLYEAGVLKRDPQIVFRELLAMSICHSKSKVPVLILDDPVALRKQMQTTMGHNLHHLYTMQQTAKGKALPVDFSFTEERPDYVNKYYSDFEGQSFDWLTDESEGARQLTNAVSDTLRALRCADAFRQRGTVERTSGGYEIYTSQKTGNCIIALRLGNSQLFLMELPNNPDGAGESNIASSEFNIEGDLRLSFHRGAFENQAAQNRSAYSTAYVIGDFLRDTVDSFWRKKPIPSVKTAQEIRILLEITDDDPNFVTLVREQLRPFCPQYHNQIEIVPSLRNASDSERTRYLLAKDFDWNAELSQSLLDNMLKAGQKFIDFDPAEGFKHVRMADLRAGEILIEARAPSAFVYIPLGDGLKIFPMGGYHSLSITGWIPMGTTGVIRGDVRNADIIAEKPISVLIIPKDIYLRHWYVPYTPLELHRILAEEAD